MKDDRFAEPLMRLPRVKQETKDNAVLQGKKTEKKGFMHHVQLHERAWGFESYAGKPALEDILRSAVVVFWRIEGKVDRYTITLHDSLKDVEKLFYQLILRNGVNTQKRRIARIYNAQKRVVPKGVRILFEEVEE